MHVCIYVMYVCMYVCMHVFMYVYVNVYLYACVCMYECLYARMHFFMFACVHARMNVCLDVCMYVCMYVQVCNVCMSFMYVCAMFIHANRLRGCLCCLSVHQARASGTITQFQLEPNDGVFSIDPIATKFECDVATPITMYNLFFVVYIIINFYYK